METLGQNRPQSCQPAAPEWKGGKYNWVSKTLTKRHNWGKRIDLCAQDWTKFLRRKKTILLQTVFLPVPVYLGIVCFGCWPPWSGSSFSDKQQLMTRAALWPLVRPIIIDINIKSDSLLSLFVLRPLVRPITRALSTTSDSKLSLFTTLSMTDSAIPLIFTSISIQAKSSQHGKVVGHFSHSVWQVGL